MAPNLELKKMGQTPLNTLMTPKKKSARVLSGAVLLTFSRVACYGLSFLRTLLLARALTQADFGLAAAFTLTIAFFEFSSRMAFGKQLIQSPAGDTNEFQNSAHAFQFAVGTVSSLIILLASPAIAATVGSPGSVLAFASLALLSFFRGFENLDAMRRQRHLQYGPSVVIELVPQLFVTLLAFPAIKWFPDYRLVLIIDIGRVIIATALSHIISTRVYRWHWSLHHFKSIFDYSWPLLISGFLLFISQQGDQLIIANFYTLENLALYSVAFTLVSIPWFIFAQVGSSVMLPLLSRTQNDPTQFALDYELSLQLAAIFSVLILLPLIVSGELILTSLYGNKYNAASPILALLAAASAIRFLRFTPAIAAMAIADTVNQMISNLFRAISIPIALVLALLGFEFGTIAVCAVIAETVAAAASLSRLRRSKFARPVSHRAPLGLFFTSLLISMVLGLFVAPRIGFYGDICLLILSATLYVLASRRFLRRGYEAIRLFAEPYMLAALRRQPRPS